MNTDFNYYDFLKKKDFKYDIKVDLSGLDLKGDASTTEVDSDTGDASEVNLNETVDENVNYVYDIGNDIVVTYPSTDLNANNELIPTTEYRFDAQDVIETDAIDFNESENPTTITVGTNDTVIPIKPRHKLMRDSEYTENNTILTAPNTELDTPLNGVNVLTITASTVLQGLNFPFRNDVIYQEKVVNSNDTGFIGFDRVFITIEGADFEPLNGEFEVSNVNETQQNVFNIRVGFNTTPTGNLGTIVKTRISYGGYVKRAAIIDREVYAALGLWNTNDLNVDDNMGVRDSHAVGFITKKSFYRSLNELNSRMNPLGIEVVTNEYIGVEDDDGVDENISFLPRNRNFNFNHSKAAGKRFLELKNSKGELLPLDSDSITPFTMSVKDAFIAQFASTDELNNELLGRLTGLIDAITENVLISSSVDLGDFIGDDANANPMPIIIRKPVGPFSYDAVIDYLTENNIPVKAIAGAYGDERDDEQLEPQLELTYVPVESSGYAKDTNGNNIVDPNDTTKLQYNLYNVYETYVDTINGDVVRFTYENGDPDAGVKIIKYTMEFNDNATRVLDRIIDFIEYIESMMGSIRSLVNVVSVTGGMAARLLLISVAKIENKYTQIESTVKRIRWYQKYTNQSVVDTGEFIEEYRQGHVWYKYNKQVARILIPVDFGTKKVKRKIPNIFGSPINVYRRIDMGVRWVEVSFIDTSTFQKYRKNDTTTGKTFILNTSFISLGLTQDNAIVRGILSVPLSDDIMNRGAETVNITVTSGDNVMMNGSFIATIIDSSTIEYKINSIPTVDTSTGAILSTLLAPLTPTKADVDPDNIRVTYNMPHLPFDDELRDKIFNDFGPFDQSIYSNKSRGGDYTVTDTGTINIDDDIPGWEIFKESSKEISDMREGIDVYNKAEFLLKILQDEFGKSRVNVIETTRSFQDQEYLQLGGNVSSFLSWHNYGLAIKIVITEKDGITAIKDGSADFMRLLDIAEGFCEGVKQGAFGTPMNVVWCGQLVTGPDIFGWEFLPIGVEHKDAIKFRESAFQQKDAVVDNAFVNVTANNYIIPAGTAPPLNGSPYILDGSKGVIDGKVINGEVWVHPKYINNYSIPNELILKDVQEFLLLIKGKMNANGTELTGRKKISEWKSKNPRSFTQLVLFYGLTGALSTTRKLLSGDYIEKFQNTVNTLAEEDPVAFVKRYLGDEEYTNVKIYLEDLSDSSYINLSDGTLTTPILDARSTHPEGSGNTFGQRQVDYGSVEFGQFQDGVFIPEGDDRIIEIKTTEPVIEGYVDGVPFEKDAVLLHTLIANQIVDEFDVIKEAFNSLSIKFMHDKFSEGSNSSLADLIENEFGVIKTQDTMTFDDLRKMYDRIAINNNKTDGDGGVRGAGANIEAQNENDGVNRNKIHSVFEKLVSNSQLTGVKRASLTKEKPIIEQLANDVKVEDVIEEIQNRRIPRVRDIL